MQLKIATSITYFIAKADARLVAEDKVEITAGLVVIVVKVDSLRIIGSE